METSPTNEPTEARSIARTTTHQHELNLKSNRFHPWLAAKRTHSKPNIAATATQPVTPDGVAKSPEEQCNTTDRIISHSINSIINGR